MGASSGRGLRDLAERHKQAMSQADRGSSRRLYRPATALARWWSTPKHLTPGQRDR